MNAEKKLLLFGGNRLNEDGPLLKIAVAAKKRGFDILVFTEAFHLSIKNHSGASFREQLMREEVRFVECDKLTREILAPHVDSYTHGLLLNAIWLIKQDIIDLFGGKLFNYHNTNLPKERGAAAYSWKILSESRSGGIAVHKVEAGLDQGDIVLHRSFTFPVNCRIPADYHAYIATKEEDFFEDLLDLIDQGKDGGVIIQIDSHSLYWPRLYTKAHGYINWNWSYKQIEKFINAFDDPYEGAMTFIEGKKVHLKKCVASNEDGVFHPFQAGIIFRRIGNSIYIAAEGGTLIIHEVIDEGKNNLISKLRVGRRFFTPYSCLEDALGIKVTQEASGVKLYKDNPGK